MQNHKFKSVFNILVDNKANFLWIVYIILASVGGLVSFINDRNQTILDGDLYYVSLSIIAPLLVDFIIQNLESKLFKLKNRFLTLKSITCGISILTISAIIIGLQINVNIIIQYIYQIILYIASIVISLYMFCLQKLALFGDDYDRLEDKSFAEDQNDRANALTKQQDSKLNVKNDNGMEIKL